jgi:hypothetical protein
MLEQNSGQAAAAATARKVEITSAQTDYEVGQHVKFSAVARDEAGKPLSEAPAKWNAMPFDVVAIDEGGTASFYQPGEVTIGVFIAAKAHFTTIVVKPAPAKTIVIDPLPAPLVVGGTARLNATAHIFNGDPRLDVAISWASDTPAIATVDAAGVITGVAPGTAILRAATGGASGTVSVRIVKNTLTGLSIEPGSANARTGDVVHLKAVPAGGGSTFAPLWRLPEVAERAQPSMRTGPLLRTVRVPISLPRTSANVGQMPRSSCVHAMASERWKWWARAFERCAGR